MTQACGAKGAKGPPGQKASLGNIVGEVVGCANNSLTITIKNNTKHALLTHNLYAQSELGGGFITCESGNQFQEFMASCQPNYRTPQCIVNGTALVTYNQTHTINTGINTIVIPFKNCGARTYQCAITLTDNTTGMTHSTIFTATF